MRIDVLGPLRVLNEAGTDVTPRGPQQRRALAALAAVSPSALTVDALEDVLWPAGAPSPNALQATVSKLRKTVAPAVIAHDGRGYALREITSDLAELEAAAAENRWDDVERVAGSDHPLPELDGTALVEPIRARVVGSVRTARSKRLALAVEGDDPGAAIGELEAFVIAEPHDEGWWAKLMVAYYRSGRQADALDAYQRARQVLASELGLEPGPELRRTEARVLEQDEGSPASSRAHSRLPPIPVPVASFVGRERELADLSHGLATHRLVTVLGPGGAGKTATALEMCRRLGDAVAFAQLAAVSDPDGLLRVVSRAIGLPDGDQTGLSGGPPQADPLERVCDALVDRALTVLLDNCEHVVSDAARFAHTVLLACPHVRLVVTSRESLGISGEHVYPLPPLPETDAVALFLDRAADHGIELGEGDRALIGEICHRLDGLPLAVELAAARLRSLSLDEVHEGLDDRFALLSHGPRVAEPRQQTLRAVVDWSHDLLDPSERAVFRRLAAFVGGATLTGATAVCAGVGPEGTEIEPAEVPSLVDRLVDKSLVRAERLTSGVRFTMLQTLHAYANEQLSASGERRKVIVEHARYVADMIKPARRGLTGHDQPWWFATLTTERSNIESALGTALAIGDAQLALDLTVPIGWYYFMAGEIESGIDAFASALACDGPTDAEDRAVALSLYGWLLSNGPDIERALAVLAEAISLLDRVEDPWARGLIVNINVMVMFFAGDLAGIDAFMPWFDELTLDSGDRWIEAITSLVKGEIAQHRGDTDEAGHRYSEAAAAFEAEGDRFAYALAITEASELAELVGDYDRAVGLLEHAISLAEEVGFSGHPLAMRARLGNLEILRGNLEAAERHHRALIEDAATSGVPWDKAMALIGLSSIARRRAEFADAKQHLARAWELRRSQSVPIMRMILQVERGYLADQQDEFGDALAHQSDAFATAVQLGMPRGMAFAFEGLAGALALSGARDHHELAAELLGAADSLRRASGGPMPAAERYDVDRAETRVRAALGDAPFDSTFAAGAQTTPTELAIRVRAVAPRPD